MFPRHRCGEMVFVAMTAFGDAAGALIPPEVAITYQWPGCILMNEGQIGYVDLIIAEEEADGVPDWMVLSIDIQMKPDFEDLNPRRKLSPDNDVGRRLWGYDKNRIVGIYCPPHSERDP